MATALATRHLGRVIHTYRTHPQHPRPLPQELVAGWLGLTQGQLSRLENGRAPEKLGDLTRHSQALRIPPHLLWFHPTGAAAPGAAAAEAAFVGEAQIALLRAHEWLVAEPPQRFARASRGRRVGAEFTRTLEGRVGQLRHLDDFIGGRDLHDLVSSELAAATAVLGDATYDERLGRRLLSAVAELSQLAGWVAMDAGHVDAARRFYLDGVSAAHAADNRPVAANLLSTLSYQYANQGDPRTAVLLARTALRGAESTATPATVALLQERVAWACAKAGDRPATEKALAAAEHHYDRRRPDDEPTWVYWLDDNEINVMAGRCYVELDQPQRAVALLADAVAVCDEEHAREAALYRSWLAEAYTRMGALDQAVEEATHVVRLDARASSARTSERVEHLRALFAAHPNTTEVRAFEDAYRSEPGFQHTQHPPSA
jgi:tetratricopeptide (TPR) repeat protein